MVVQNPPTLTTTGQRQETGLRKSSSFCDLKTYENLSKIRQQPRTRPTLGIPNFVWQTVNVPKRGQPPSSSDWNTRPVSPSEWKPMPIPPRDNKGISLMLLEKQQQNEVYDDLVPHNLTTNRAAAAASAGPTNRKPLYQHLELGSLDTDSEYKVVAVKRYV